MKRVWMALDPETRRVCIQDREFSDGDFPPGLRGLGWAQRQAELEEEIWEALLSNALPWPELDAVHRTLWTEAGPTPWPQD